MTYIDNYTNFKTRQRRKVLKKNFGRSGEAAGKGCGWSLCPSWDPDGVSKQKQDRGEPSSYPLRIPEGCTDCNGLDGQSSYCYKHVQ